MPLLQLRNKHRNGGYKRHREGLTAIMECLIASESELAILFHGMKKRTQAEVNYAEKRQKMRYAVETAPSTCSSIRHAHEMRDCNKDERCGAREKYNIFVRNASIFSWSEHATKLRFIKRPDERELSKAFMRV